MNKLCAGSRWREFDVKAQLEDLARNSWIFVGLQLLCAARSLDLMNDIQNLGIDESTPKATCSKLSSGALQEVMCPRQSERVPSVAATEHRKRCTECLRSEIAREHRNMRPACGGVVMR